MNNILHPQNNKASQSIYRLICIQAIIYLVITFTAQCESAPIKSLSSINTLSPLNTQSINDFLLQMSAVISSQNKSSIDAFFNFYITDDAQFRIQSTLYTDGGLNKETEVSALYNKGNYITYQYNISHTSICYAYEAILNKLELSEDGGNAIASVSIKEISIIKVSSTPQSSLPNVQSNNKDATFAYIKAIGAINCNMALSYSATILIDGANCIKKISIQ